MKKTVLLVSICLSSVYAVAQSTCETRVDAHPKATTLQRVHYCLTPEVGAPVQRAGENLVFSGISSRQGPAPKQEVEKPSARNGSFTPQKVEVVQHLVPTETFPQLTNEQLSEQEKLARQKALEEERAKIEQALAKEDLKPQEHMMSEVLETTSGLKARKKKPGRRWVKQPQVDASQENASVQPSVEPDTLEEVSPVAEEYAYDQSALPAEISSYTPYTPADQTPNSAYEPYAPAEQTSSEYGTYSPATIQQDTSSGTSTYAPAN